MPVPVHEQKLAASPGHDAKREAARKNVVIAFLTEHLYEPDEDKDFALVRAAAQMVDYTRPVTIGPEPIAPRRLVLLRTPLGAGFFAEQQPKGQAQGTAEWWNILPHAIYLRYHARTLAKELLPPEPETARYFLPGVRHPKGQRVAARERG